MGRPLLEMRNVWKRLCRRPERGLRYALADIGRDLLGQAPQRELRDGEFWALRDVSLTVRPGQVVGVIGHNGAGKSTLLNLVSGIMLPTAGSIQLSTSRVVIIDASGGLNAVETGRENAATQLALHGVSEGRIAQEIAAVEAFADIGDFLDAPVGTYSLGMRLRLAFSIYSRLSPDLFIVDEALGGGDLRFSNRFRSYLREYVDGGGAMLLCSHTMLAIQMFCDHALLLDRGQMVLEGDPLQVIDRYHSLADEREAQAGRRRTGVEGVAGPLVDERFAIESVQVSSGDDGPVRPGGSLVVEVQVRVAEEIADVCCGIEIGQGELTSLATLVGGYPDESFTLRPPERLFRCRIDHLPLAAGNYDLRVAVYVPRSATTLALRGYTDAATLLTVFSPVDPLNNVARGRKNLVHVANTWELVETPPPA